MTSKNVIISKKLILNSDERDVEINKQYRYKNEKGMLKE